MQLNNRKFSMSKADVAEFSMWLNNHPNETQKRSIEVVKAFADYKNKSFSPPKEEEARCI